MTLFRWTLLLGLPAVLLGTGIFLIIRYWPASTADSLPAVTVEAVYPGANAQILADTVAEPIEHQIQGVEKMQALTSRCGNDGVYTLTVTFEPGTNLELAQVLVQNRVSLALPVLPAVVQRQGLTVKKKSLGPILLVCLYSPDNRFGSIYLSNYARIQLKDEFAHLPGVNEVVLFGSQDYSMRIWLDPDKLAARNLTSNDVLRALEAQNIQVAAEPVGERLNFTMTTMGRLAIPAQFEDILVKDEGGGWPIRLRDVARVELGASQVDGHASLDGSTCVVLGLYLARDARPQEVNAAFHQLQAVLDPCLPKGLSLAAAFDFTENLRESSWAPHYLVLDIQLPDGASIERIREVQHRCAALVQASAMVDHVLELSEHPFDTAGARPCLLVRLNGLEITRSERETLVKRIRNQLDTEIHEAIIRVRDLSGASRFPRCAYPIDLALCGPERPSVQTWAENLAERLRQRDELRDVWINPESRSVPQLSVEIDNAKAKALGVKPEDIFATLQVILGMPNQDQVNRFGRTWQVTVDVDARFRQRAEDLAQLKVRNTGGQMVPLSALAAVRNTEGPHAIYRFNGQLMIELTANLTPGNSVTQVRALCESLANEAHQELHLSGEYKLHWQNALGR
jgi:multidrug efflux pump subunit AcrB